MSDAATNPFPPTITVHGEELVALVARAKAGEFTIHQLKVGATPSEWVCSVSYPQKKTVAAPDPLLMPSRSKCF